MKKFLVALVVLAAATTFSIAGVGITWTCGFGAYDHTVTPPLNGGSGALLDSYSAIWQLIYAGANNAIETPSELNAANGYVNLTGDDVVWRERDIPLGGNAAGVPCPADGTTWDNWMVWTGVGDNSYQNAWSTPGYVYQRIFEGTPALDTWYYDSPLLALDTGYVVGGGGPMQDFALDTGSAGFQPDQRVPEPATMGLLGLGALVMAIRRRRS